jgi:hypothetical protein
VGLSKIEISRTELNPETFTMSKKIIISLNSEAMQEKATLESPDVMITTLVKEYETFLRAERAQQVKQL